MTQKSEPRVKHRAKLTEGFSLEEQNKSKEISQDTEKVLMRANVLLAPEMYKAQNDALTNANPFLLFLFRSDLLPLHVFYQRLVLFLFTRLPGSIAFFLPPFVAYFVFDCFVFTAIAFICSVLKHSLTNVVRSPVRRRNEQKTALLKTNESEMKCCISKN